MDINRQWEAHHPAMASMLIIDGASQHQLWFCSLWMSVQVQYTTLDANAHQQGVDVQSPHNPPGLL